MAYPAEGDLAEEREHADAETDEMCEFSAGNLVASGVIWPSNVRIYIMNILKAHLFRFVLNSPPESHIRGRGSWTRTEISEHGAYFFVFEMLFDTYSLPLSEYRKALSASKELSTKHLVLAILLQRLTKYLNLTRDTEMRVV